MSTIVSDEMPGESSPDSVLAPQGFINLGDFKLPDSKKSKRDHGAAASTPAWAITDEFNALDQQGALLEGGGSAATPPSPQSNFSLPALGVTSNHSRTADFFVRTKDGFLCSKPLTSEDLLMLEEGVGAKHGTLCKLFFGPKPAPKLVKTPRGAKTTEHEAALRQSNPCYGSLAPTLTRSNCAEVSYDPLKRFNVIGDKVPRGFKSAEHVEILRTSEPCFGSLNPDATRPNRAEHSYDPLKRFAAVGEKKMARGYKSTEHLAILRTSSPLYSSLAPDLTRPNRAEHSFDPLKRFAAVGDKVSRGFKSLEHEEVLRQSDPSYGSLAPDLTRPNRAEYSFDPLKRFATVGDKAPRGFKSTEHVEVLRQSDPSYGSLAPDLTRPNHAEYSFEPLRRFAALSKRIGRGFKSTEHEEILRQSSPCFGSLAPDLTRPNCAEVSYDPLKRFTAVSERLPRGAKSVEHLALMRASDPCFGSLACDATRPNRAEHSYDPLRRYAAIGERTAPRGAKSLAHMEVLRTSNPCYGSLAPSLRGSRAEYSFDPRKRFAALAWTAREPRGSKTAAHLAILRTSDPTYGTLAPSRTRQPPAVVSSLAAVGKLRGLTRVVSVDGLDGWQNITPDAAAPAMEEQAARLPEVGLQLPEWPEEQSDDDDGEADDEADDDALPELQGWGMRRRRPRASSTSFDSDSASMARTADRDWNEPRASNDTIASFMDDSNDGHASGEWAGYQMSSPRRAKPAKPAAAGGKFPAAKAALEGPAEDGPKHPGNAAAWGWAATSH